MKCPGQDTQYWTAEAIFDAKCPQCGTEVEFFKDDTARKCGQCGHRLINPNMDFGCAAYCQYAEQCLGTLPPELMAQKEDLLKDRAAIEMKRYFKQDFKRIGHAMRVARYAERIGKKEMANMAVVLVAAHLYNIGACSASRQPDEVTENLLAAESVNIARTILEHLNARPQLADEVCSVLARKKKSSGDLSASVVHDADLLTTLEAEYKEKPEMVPDGVTTRFRTPSGRKEARRVLNLQLDNKKR